MNQETTSLDLGRGPVRQSFFHFLLPAITGMVIKSLYVVADTMFIGHTMGESGLAAINIVIPYFAFMFAIAMMVGVGGAAMMGIRFGEGRLEDGREIFRQALTFITLVMVAMTGATLPWLDQVVMAFGARGELIPMARDYVGILTLFATPYAVGWVLSNFVRNDGNPKLVMYAMIASAVLNVFLDWVFMVVLNWGMSGAALATGLAQLSLAAVHLLHFRHPRCQLQLGLVRPDLRAIRAIVANGMPTFVMEASVGIVILASNWVLMALGGKLYLSVYTVALNCMWLVVLLVYGVCQAVQPLVSYNHGARQPDRILETLNLGIILILLVCSFFGVLAMLFPGQVVAAFVSTPSREMIELGEWVMRLYGVAVIPMGLNILTMTVFQSIARSPISSLISWSRGLVLPIAGLLLLPMVSSESLVWANILFAELLVLAVCLVLLRTFQNRLRQQIQTRLEQGGQGVAVQAM